MMSGKVLKNGIAVCISFEKLSIKKAGNIKTSCNKKRELSLLRDEKNTFPALRMDGKEDRSV